MKGQSLLKVVSKGSELGEFGKLIFNNSPGCLKILDLAGNLISMNENGRRILEVEDFEKIQGKPWVALWPIESHDALLNSLAVARKGERGQFYGFCPTEKGTPKWWLVHVTPLRDKKGDFSSLLAVSNDVTELHKTRQKLEEINKRRDLMMQAGKIGEWSLDIATGVATCSGQHDQCFGFDEPVPNWTFNRFINLIHPDDRSQVKEKIERAIKNRQVLRDEYRVIWPNGSVHWIASMGIAHAEQGRPPHWLGVVQNITDRKRAEAIDRGQKKAFERMIEGATLSQILEALCYAAEEHSGGISHACILTADINAQLLHHAASPSLPKNFQLAVNEMLISASSEACGKAAYLRKSIFIEHIEASSLNDELKALARTCGLRSCWTMPIISAEEKLLGTFAVYYRSPYHSTENDKDAIGSLVNTIALILDRYRQAEEKQQAENAFCNAQARLNATLAAAEVATWTFDIRANRLYGDTNLRHLLSLSMSDVNVWDGEMLFHSVHPDDVERVKDIMQKSTEAGQPYEIHYNVCLPSGHCRTVLARGHTEYDEKNNPLRVSGVLLDVSREREAERKLQVSRERYHRLFRMMDQGLCIIEILYDIDGHPYDCRYIESNPAFESYTGLFNVNGKTFRSLVPDIEQFWMDKYSDVAKTGTPIRFEKESRSMNRWFDVYAARVDDSDKYISILFTDITARKHSEKLILAYNEKLDREANYDALTELPNRRLFQDRLAQEIRRGEQDHRSLYVLFLDLDNFKEVNDLLGHNAGDSLLKEVASRIQRSIKINDTAARLGGDEFTIILIEDIDCHVEQLAERILNEISQPYDIGFEQIKLTCSIGITAYPNDAKNPEHLMRNADQAMYLSKTSGKNQLTFFEHSMHVEAMRRLRLISELREALSENQLVLYFQPIIDLVTGRITKAEALLRWNHPTRGVVLPGEFIGLIEETEMIHEIGDWIFDEALTFLQKWEKELGIKIQLSINKSSKQFLKKGHTAEWVKKFQNSGISRNRLVIEITESVLIKKADVVSENLRQLHQCGLLLSIDDFGTGYSSMGYLKKLDVDFLKLDQLFVRDLIIDPTNTIIVETIIAMGHKLGLKIVAEGVETEQQRDWLRSHNCDYVQGHLVSEALPLDAFEKLLMNTRG